MHILVINDDGPPSQLSSPYVHPLIETLQKGGHTVSVVLPHQQRSWIAKAHFAGQVTKPTYFRPGTIHQDDGITHDQPSIADEWILVNGTPATCAQLGIFHFFQDRGPVDLVVSGPNYGRNSTALFSLSSGTLGGALEAAICRKKAIAISFAFTSREHVPKIIAGACRQSLRLIEHLHSHWAEDVDVYSINVPVVEDIEDRKVLYTYALQNYWTSGSSFEEIEATDDESLENREMEIRQRGEVDGGDLQEPKAKQRHRHFKWAPKFSDITQSIEDGPAGNDGWAIMQDYTSVTPLKANFMHVPSTQLGELKLPQNPSVKHDNHIYASIDYEDPYVQPLILQALEFHLPRRSYTLISSLSSLPTPTSPLLQITSYEKIDFGHVLSHSTTSMANAYVIRKALIRKHYLAHTVSAWCVKHPDSSLKNHVKQTLDFELDYAEFLDEALLEAYELHESFAYNATRPPEVHEWWILKPGMSDRGQGIRLFSTEAQLATIFQAWDPDSDEESESNQATPADDDGIITSQLRHFVAQQYIHPPLLLPHRQNRKFHLRSYVLALGALRVYVYGEFLALFAPLPYEAPAAADAFNPDIHLTNTCLQPDASDDAISLFSHLPSSAPGLVGDWKRDVETQILAATGELFLAAARTQSTHFQPLPNGFEVFGIDWLVDAGGRVWLLEVNAFPDFARSGELGRGVVGGVWEAVVGLVVEGGVLGGGGEGKGKGGMREVLDVDLGRR